jgi:hypothetical protein
MHFICDKSKINHSSTTQYSSVYKQYKLITTDNITSTQDDINASYEETKDGVD